MSHLTRPEALVLAKAHITWLKRNNRFIDATALETLLFNSRCPRNEEGAHFEVVGAGELQVGQSSLGRCGPATGVALGVSWGTYGYAGGVIDKKDVVRLIAHLQSVLAEVETPIVQEANHVLVE